MKWTTLAAQAATAHWSGFRQSERHSVPCSNLCHAFEKDGKRYVTHYEESGCEYKPEPTTPRGKRRRKLKQDGGA